MCERDNRLHHPDLDVGLCHIFLLPSVQVKQKENRASVCMQKCYVSQENCVEDNK